MKSFLFQLSFLLLASFAATPATAQDSSLTTPAKTFTYHEVEDFTAWKAMYDGAYEMRRQAGELTATVGMLADRPNTVWIVNTWTSTAAAKAHLANKEVAAKMAEGGVTSPPTVYFLDQKDKGTLTNGSGIMTLTMHPVAEFGKWKNMFDGAEAIRKTAGELDYETGGVNGDPNQVYVLNEYTSESSARAHFGNPHVAAAMKKGGVTGAPVFFIMRRAAR
jgi:quinol monooxygenase YgiN